MSREVEEDVVYCILAGPGRFNGGVDRPPGPDGEPPAEIEVVAARRPRDAGGVDDVDVIVYRRDGLTRDGEPRYVRDRVYSEERPTGV